VEVATGTLIQPSERIMHGSQMDPTVMKVKLVKIVPEYRDILPPFQPPGCDEGDTMVLGDCTSWVMKWPKTQIRLGGVF